MGFPTVTYREQLGKIGQLLIDELDQLVAQIQGFLSKQHKSDGSHSAITADRVTVTGDLTVGGESTLDGNLYVTPTPLTGAGDPGYSEFTLGSFSEHGTPYVGLQWPQTDASHAAYVAYGVGAAYPTTPTDSGQLKVLHHSAAHGAILILRAGLAGLGHGWFLIPDFVTAVGDNGVSLGDDINGSRFTHVYGEYLHANTAIYERGRTTPVGEWTAYTPTWGSTGTAPALGNGLITGAYAMVGKTVFFSVAITMGSTTTFGTGAYVFGYPVTAVGNLGGQSWAVDASPSTNYAGILFHVSASTFTAIINLGTAWNAGVPITWASGDRMIFTGTYQAA